MSFWENNKSWMQWAVPIVLGLFSTGGLGTLIAKGLTADAKDEVRKEMQVNIDKKDDYIKTLENEIDALQLDVITTGFKYDMCCTTSPNCN